jgi:guanylate kinase
MGELKHRAEFRSILADYVLSPSAMNILRHTPLVLLAGPTSSGRNTIISELVKTGDYYHIVADTTRQIREKDGKPIEENGREYWFRGEEDMLADLRKGQYMEAAIIHNQQVSGCSIRELTKAREASQIAIKDIEPNGAHTIHGIKPDTTIIFIVPPSFESWMQRLRERGCLPLDEVQRRLTSACGEFMMALTHSYYVFVINEKLVSTVAEVHAVAKLGEVDPVKQQYGRQLVEALNQATREYLQANTP